jgi:cephalosporin-C deacetylase-like acetyl esterase
LDLQAGKATLSGTLEEPGFLLLRVRSGDVTTLASAGFEPEKLQPSLPVPDDFDEFWNARKAELAAVPVNPTLASVASDVPNVEIFDLKLDCIGPSVTGYFGRPKGAPPKSLPAILYLHGAGVRSANLGNVTSWASKEGGMLAMDINAHGLPNGKTAAFYEDIAKGGYAGYQFRGRTDRRQTYFLGMFLRVLRASDFLTAQPEWDGKTLILYGTSQGAFQTFAGAALDHRVSFICAGVPAGCDHTGFAAARISGWPKWVPIDPDGKPDQAAMETSRYFDNVNFATRIRCAGAAVTVGFIDVVCPPTTVYAAYNALTVPKSMHIDPLAGHINTPAAQIFFCKILQCF